MSLAARDTRPGRWVADAAGLYLHRQVESGTTCPSIMTWACIPLLEREPSLWPALKDKLYSDDYDARDLPLDEKRSIYVGMGMTEKQGGSDVRANTTDAAPLARPAAAAYAITGHKWFFSAPMCDALLVLAQAPTRAVVLLRAALEARRQRNARADPAPEGQAGQPVATLAPRSNSTTRAAPGRRGGPRHRRRSSRWAR